MKARVTIAALSIAALALASGCKGDQGPVGPPGPPGPGGDAGPGGVITVPSNAETPTDAAVAGVTPEQLERIVEIVAERRQRRDRLALKVGERFLLVQADEVIYASLANDVITVVAGKHVGTSSCRTLDELQEQLDPSIFWRVHRSHLVNINKVKEIVPWFNRNYLLRMKDEKATEIPVSRNHTRRLREYLKL